MFRMFKRFDIDMREEPILVFPTLHYQNGGIEINSNAEVLSPNGVIHGLFAAGEVTGGVHGKNRLMGNSLLDTQVFGRIAGINAAKYVINRRIGKLNMEHVKRYIDELRKERIEEKRRAPMILPDYREKRVLSRAIDIL